MTPKKKKTMLTKISSKGEFSIFKDRKGYWQDYNNRPEIKQKRKLARLAKQQKKDNQETEKLSKFYGAEAFKVLMSFKEYTELSKEKKKLWQDFNWTLQDCQEEIKEGLGSVASIMKLELVASKLVRDYWTTAKNEEKQKSKNWNILDYDKQKRLLKFWGREKARIENGYIDEVEKLERQGDSYLKELDIQKFHEERGKIKCDCWQCEEKKKIQQEVRSRIKKELAEAEKEIDNYWGVRSKDNKNGKCSECGNFKKLVEDVDLCKNCYENYGV